ncbi:MAG: hypothetical protein GF331_23260 [Chitinivibrionales bacterium]|nr:hypothetical protein [Chitinivibrionales bacterium]
MKGLRRFVSVCAMLGVLLSAAQPKAQDFAISGMVTDSTGSPIRGATVVLPAFSCTTTTGLFGNFTLDSRTMSLGHDAARSSINWVRFAGTKVIVNLPAADKVTVRMLGMDGRVLSALTFDDLAAGRHVLETGRMSEDAAAGTRIIQIELNGCTFIRRMLRVGRQPSAPARVSLSSTPAHSSAKQAGHSSYSITISKPRYATRRIPLNSLTEDLGIIVLYSSGEVIESQHRVYVPLSLKRGEKVRAYYRSVFSQFPDIPVLRDFAERARFAIGPAANENVVEEGADLAALGTQYGHPEFGTVPVVYYSHSAGAYNGWWGPTNAALLHKTLALIGHHSLMSHAISQEAADFPWWGVIPEPPTLTIRPEVLGHDPRCREVPVWNLQGALDNHNTLHPLNLAASAMVSELGWPWTFTLGYGESHGSNDTEALKLQGLWLEAVADLRIEPGRDTLSDVNHEECWVGYIQMYQSTWFTDTRQSWVVEDIDVYPHASAPGSGVVDFADTGRYGGYVWLPSESFARAWKNYHLTGRVDGDTTSGIRTSWWPTLEDLATGDLSFDAFDQSGGYYLALSMQLPGEDVTWEAVKCPPEIIIDPQGRLKTDNIDEGVFEVRLRATSAAGTWEDDWLFGLRGAMNDEILRFAIETPPDTIATGASLSVNWESSHPLGLLQWHSSIDGDLGAELNNQGLGPRGTITLDSLSPGTHLISLLAYSAAPTTRRRALSFLVTVAG